MHLHSLDRLTALSISDSVDTGGEYCAGCGKDTGRTERLCICLAFAAAI